MLPFFPPLLPLSLQFFLVLAHTLIMFPSPSRTQLHVIYDLKLFRELMCCRSRTSCSRPRLSLVSWCRACGPIFRVLLVPFIALVPLFPWPSRSSFWAFFVVVVCAWFLLRFDIVPLHSSTLHPAASAPSVPRVVNPRAALLGYLHVSLGIVGDFVQYPSAYQPRARSPDPFHWIFRGHQLGFPPLGLLPRLGESAKPAATLKDPISCRIKPKSEVQRWREFCPEEITNGVSCFRKRRD